jgi:putative two-component system response regulator
MNMIISMLSFYDSLELEQVFDTHIDCLLRALALRDVETEEHTRRVTSLTLNLAQLLDVSETELAHIRSGALLHDIGKIGIPDLILHKATPLTQEELVILQKHPTYAYELLRPIPCLQPELDIP